MASQTGLWASYLKKKFISAGIGYIGWSLMRNSGFSVAASRQIPATKNLSTQKTENLDGKLDQDNKSKLIAEMMSKSVYNEATKKLSTQKIENLDGILDQGNMSKLIEETTSKSVDNEATMKLSTQKTENFDGKLDQGNMSKLIEETMSKSVYNEATKKLSTQKPENVDGKLDQGNISKLIEETTSKSVYNEVERARISAMFEQWIIDHNRMYRSEGEKELRFGIFYSNIKKIEAHNSSCDGCKLGLTAFTDLTQREFRRKYCGGRRVRSDRAD